MAEIGHRNYKKIDVETLSPEQKHAWETRYVNTHVVGRVPRSWEADQETGEWEVIYYRVVFNEGFTFVEDNEGNIYDLISGYITPDEISLRNKGKTTEDLLRCYYQFVADTLYPQRNAFFN